MTRREELEVKCSALYGSATDIKKRLEILKDAYWQAHNSSYCDAMANRLMGGQSDYQTDFWEKACRLKWEVEWLIDIYKQELGNEGG